MLPPGRIESKPRASFLSVVFLWAIVTASASVPVDKCPRSLDCAREGRHFCQPGSSHCGPCLTPLEENEDGRCVSEVKRHAHFGKLTPLPELDEAIDLLSAIIAKQQRSEVGQSVSPSEAVPRPKPEGSKRKNPPNSTTIPPITPTEPEGRGGPLAIPHPSRDGLLLIMITVSVVLGTVALLVAVVCWIRVQRDMRLAQKVDYPALSGTRPNSSDSTTTGDRKLAQSAQMYHYQHQKQQMLSMEKHKDEPKVPDSGATSDEENEDGDFTVYECPGLAPTGEMEVKNPLFDDHTLHPHRKPK